jgi:multidrug transporter EmrE-like cation transporter
MPSVALILSSVLLGVVGQLILKSAVLGIGPLYLGQSSVVAVAWRVFSRVGIWAGLGLYGVSTFFWLVALSQVELGYAYPFISLTYVFILAASWALFKETVSLLRVLGVFVICFGVYAVAIG